MSFMRLVELGGSLYRSLADADETLALAVRKRVSAEELLTASHRYDPNIPRQEAARLLRESYDLVSPMLDKEKWREDPDFLLPIPLAMRLWKLPYLEEAWQSRLRELETRHLMGTVITGMLKTAHDRFTTCYEKLAANIGPRPSPAEYNRFNNRMEPGGTYMIGGNEKGMAKVAESRRRYDAAWMQLVAATENPAA